MTLQPRGGIEQGLTLEHGIVSTGRIFHAGNYLALFDNGAREDEMKRSKLLFSIVVALAVLSLVATTALADGIPPVTVDPGEEESAAPVNRDKYTTQPENFVPSPDMISVDGAAIPISPAYESVYTKRPTFYFNRDFFATNYEIEVYSYQTSSVVYTYQGPGTCTNYYCTLKPSQKLKFDRYGYNGEYRWRVRSYTGSWQDWSPVVGFIVLSKGFEDSFLTTPWANSTGRWWNVNHPSFTWKLTSTKSQLKAPGEFNWWSTAIAHETFYDVDVTVRMKRKYNETNSNAVLIWGDLWPTGSSNQLHDGIYFQYTNEAIGETPNWSVWMNKDGEFYWIKYWTPSSAIIPYKWNELQIVGRYPYIDLWINGTYLGWFQVNTFGYGMVGISMVDATPPSGPLLVDWVKAKPIPYGVTMEHDPAMQLGLDAGPATMEEVTGSK